MSELKTLKNIDFYEADTQKEIESRIKAEAVKWVKVIDKNLYSESEADYLDKQKISGLTASIEWIKFFFNLTDEDLKTEELVVEHE